MKRLGPAREVNIAGFLLAWRPQFDQPQFIEIEGKICLPIFSRLAQLNAGMRDIGVSDYTVKEINAPGDFLALMAKQGIALCLDPRREEGKVRFALVRSK